MVCANAGDSRACYSGAEGTPTQALSHDHKPSNQRERRRIERAGGLVAGGRVDGCLAVSRGLGDFKFKQEAGLPPKRQRVSAEAEVMVRARAANRTTRAPQVPAAAQAQL